jgi:hypothetical protein
MLWYNSTKEKGKKGQSGEKNTSHVKRCGRSKCPHYRNQTKSNSKEKSTPAF